MRANETYSEAKRQFSARNRDVLMNAQYPHKWRSTLKFAVFDLSLSLPPLVDGGGGLVYYTQLNDEDRCFNSVDTGN